MITMRKKRLFFALSLIQVHHIVSMELPATKGTFISAINSRKAPLVRDYLRSGIDVNAIYGDGKTALHYAVQKGDGEIVSLLLGAGANIF